MSDPEGIVLAFLAFRETADALINPVCGKNRSPAGKYFMPVSLMSYVPNQLIIGGIKYVVQGYCQFNNAQTGSKMASFNRYHINNVLTQFITKLRQLVFTEFAKIGGIGNFFE